jgi:hypothetical protein
VLGVAVGIAAEVIGAHSLYAQQAPDPRVADLIQAGRVRVGLGLGTPITGRLPQVARGRVMLPGAGESWACGCETPSSEACET